MKIAFQGELGANSHIAIDEAYPGAEVLPCATFEAALGETSSGDADLGMIPIENSIAGLSRYPDGNGFELKQALSRRLGVAQECIVLGNGSNDVLEMAARAFLAPGLEAVYSQHAFAVYPLAVQGAGAAGAEVPAKV